MIPETFIAGVDLVRELHARRERPAHTPPQAPALRTLRQVAGRLQAVVRQRTRLINQFHHLLALSFPELALLIKDIATGWVLELVHRYPTAQLLAGAASTDLANIPYLPDQHIDALLEHARTSIASLSRPAVAGSWATTSTCSASTGTMPQIGVLMAFPLSGIRIRRRARTN
jgi:hypothetical protein